MLIILLQSSTAIGIGITIILVVVIILGIIFYLVPIDLYISAVFSGVKLSIGQMIGMRLRRVNPKIIVEQLIKARKAGITDVNLNVLEAHYLASGNIDTVVDALISAKNAGIELDFEQAAAIDLAGRDVREAVIDSVNTKVIVSPAVEAIAKNGIQLIARASITVRVQLDRLVGGAGEDTITARVGQGIVAAIGSAESHEDILANPAIISEKIMSEGFITGTAYDVLSVDIADIDIGENVGAKLQAEEAEKDIMTARAKAEEKRASAEAEEQYYRARVQEMKAKKLEAESEIPQAISDALRKGNLGIMDYTRLQNIEADTKMREAFSSYGEDDEDDDNR